MKTQIMKTIKIEQVLNGFIVYLNYYNNHMDIIPVKEERKVFNTQNQLNKFLTEYFKTE